MKYAVLMWGAEVTSANNAIRFYRSTGAGANPPPAAAWTASLTTTAHATIADFIPIGNGTGYDILTALANALTAADGTDTYSVTPATDATTGRITGKIVVTNDAGNDFSLLLTDPLTTIDPSWFGWHQAKVFVRNPAYNTRSSTSGAYTSTVRSSLMWVSPYPPALHAYEPNPRARTVGLETISGRSHTRRIAVRAPFGFLTLNNQATQKTQSGNQVGGAFTIEYDSLEARYVHRQTANDQNDSLEVWWDHASAGKWFILFEDEAQIRAGTGQNENVLFCRLLDRTQQEDYGAIVTPQAQSSPRLWDARMNLTSIDVNHIGAGGS